MEPGFAFGVPPAPTFRIQRLVMAWLRSAATPQLSLITSSLPCPLALSQDNGCLNYTCLSVQVPAFTPTSLH